MRIEYSSKDNRIESTFLDFKRALESFSGTNVNFKSNENYSGGYDGMSTSDMKTIANVFNTVSDYLSDHHLIDEHDKLSISNESVRLKNNSSYNFSEDRIDSLIRNCNVAEKYVKPATLYFVSNLAKLLNTDYSHLFTQHFNRDSIGDSTKSFVDGRESLYSPRISTMLSQQEFLPSQALESFGATADKMAPDVRMILTVAILKFRKGILNRLAHRIPTTSPAVSFLSSYIEVFDYTNAGNLTQEAKDNTLTTRPMIDLYRDPTLVNASLKKVECRAVNDPTNKFLVTDNILKTNVDIPLYRMSLENNKVGYNHADHTDRISEGAVFEALLIEVTHNSNTETFEIKTGNLAGSRYVSGTNNNESSEKVCNITDAREQYTYESKTSAGSASTVFANVTGDDMIVCNFKVASTLHLRKAMVHAMASVTLSAASKVKNGTPTPEAIQLADTAVVKVVGYRLNARHSEENMRKSTISAVQRQYQKSVEIPSGINVLLDYSFQQTLPEELMNNVTDLISLGQDDRAVDIIMDTLKHVFDSIKLERNEVNTAVPNRVAINYAAGMTIRPSVYIGAIDPTKATVWQSSNEYGDVRNYVEYELLKIASLLKARSYYNHQLNEGETVQFNVVTSPTIMDILLSLPHTHQHIQANGDRAVDSKGQIEMIRILPNGIQLNFITSNFEKLTDKIIMVPFRPEYPESELNFGHNWDSGTIVSNYTNTNDNSGFKRLFATSRELLIPTCPIGAVIDIAGLDKNIDIFGLLK